MELYNKTARAWHHLLANRTVDWPLLLMTRRHHQSNCHVHDDHVRQTATRIAQCCSADDHQIGILPAKNSSKDRSRRVKHRKVIQTRRSPWSLPCPACGTGKLNNHLSSMLLYSTSGQNDVYNSTEESRHCRPLIWATSSLPPCLSTAYKSTWK